MRHSGHDDNRPDDDWREGLEKRIDDHETRVRVLESFRNYVLGGAAIILGAIGMFGDKLKHLLGWS